MKNGLVRRFKREVRPPLDSSPSLGVFFFFFLRVGRSYLISVSYMFDVWLSDNCGLILVFNFTYFLFKFPSFSF